MEFKAKVVKVFDSGNIKAICELTLDDMFVIHHIRVIEGKNGLFAAMPDETKKDRDGNIHHYDIVHPISADVRAKLNDSVINAYENHIKSNCETKE